MLLLSFNHYLVFVEARELLLSDILVKSHGGAVWLNDKMNGYLFPLKMQIPNVSCRVEAPSSLAAAVHAG